MTTILPLGKRILAQMIGTEETMRGGIILPTAEKKQFDKAKVLAVGNDVTSMKVGDVIFINRFLVSELEQDSEKFLVIDEDKVLALVTA